MSDQISSFLVILDEDLHEEHAEQLRNAIREFRHVVDVQMNVADVPQTIANVRAWNAMTTKVIDALGELKA